MKTKNIFIFGALACSMGILTACDAHVDDDTLGSLVPAEVIAANLEVRGITPGSNKVILKNNNMNVGGMWDYLVGVTTAQCDTVLIPFLGEQTLTFYATCAGGQVQVQKTVKIEQIDHPLDPAWEMLAGTTAEGKSWTWNDVYPDGSWGCYGAGGYGWSNVGPNWDCIGIGDTYGDGKGSVDVNEYITFDLNGGANATFHKADGTVVKGSFVFTIGTTSEKAAQGWFGTLELHDTNLPLPYNYYGQTASSGKYDIAVFTDGELILIEPDPGALFCDPAWASCSTHWCFKAK